MAYNQSSRDSMADGQAIIGPHRPQGGAVVANIADSNNAGASAATGTISGASTIVENNAGNVNKNEEAIDWSPIVTCYALLDDIQYKMGKIEENFDAIAS